MASYIHQEYDEISQGHILSEHDRHGTYLLSSTRFPPAVDDRL